MKFDLYMRRNWKWIFLLGIILAILAMAGCATKPIPVDNPDYKIVIPTITKKGVKFQ